MADYLVREEDGVSRFTLEEGGGSILLETSADTVVTGMFDQPTPGGGMFDQPTPGGGHFDSPTPS